MNIKFEQLNHDEAVSGNLTFLGLSKTFKVREFLEKLGYSLGHETTKKLFEGIEIEVLRFGEKSWKKGTLKLTLEFCPDEPIAEENPVKNGAKIVQPESPLDDLHQIINETN